MPLEREESGFYFGTTSIGYVLSILFVILPICILVVMEKVGVWTGVFIALGGSVFLCIGLYPVLLCWVIFTYYVLQPNELTANHSNNDASSRS